MPLIYCPECGKQVSSESVACPGCGFPVHRNVAIRGQSPTKNSNSLWGLILGLISLFLPILFLDLFIGVFAVALSIKGYKSGQARSLSIWAIVISAIAVVGALTILVAAPDFYSTF